MAKKPYDRPLIRRHVVGQAPKFGLATSIKVLRDVDGIKVEDLMAQYGSPLFVISEKALRSAHERLARAMGFYFPDVVLAWSYKTNWLRSVCAIFHQEGSWAEVVSEFEYEKARSLGVPGDRIIFNGPYKPREALARAFSEGAQVNLDSLDEMYLAEEVAEELGLRPKVGLRISLAAGAYPIWYRFGFNYESGEAMEAAERITRRGRLVISGLHCHMGTFVLDPWCFTEQSRKLAALTRALEKRLDIELDYLNFGGGFASKNTLVHQYLPGETVSPPFEEYAAALAEGMKALDRKPTGMPRIILETGRALVDEAGYLMTSVVAVKRMPAGLRAVIVDAGVNLLYTAFWYRHEVFPAREVEGDIEEAVIYGPLCMNIDVVRESVMLPTLRPGDPLVIWPVGAYNMTQWLQFIRLRPGVVLITPEGETELIRMPDVMDDLLSREPVSARLGLRGAE
ncbi:MAG: alanine racemase [Proteobacteria bacterium]|nr:alanine racemase [Pseudomonadota bacterium]